MTFAANLIFIPEDASFSRFPGKSLTNIVMGPRNSVPMLTESEVFTPGLDFLSLETLAGWPMSYRPTVRASERKGSA